MKKNHLLLLSFLAILTGVFSCTKDASFPSMVTEGPTPTADFTASSGSLDVAFTNNSKDAETYYWDFGDGTNSTEQSPVHNYATAGRYEVTLKTRSSAGYSSSSSQLILAASAAEAKFDVAVSSGVYKEFNNLSNSLDSNVWDFGDNSASSSEINPSHIFPAAGTYPVTLTVYGILGDTVSITQNVEVGYETINGGGFEVDDSKFWKAWSSQSDNPPTFGYTADGPSNGSGGSLAFAPVTAPSNTGKNQLMYQPVFVQAGKKYQFSAQVKVPSGGSQTYLQFYISPDANTWNENNGADPTQLFVSLNSWHGWGGTSGAGPTVAADGEMIAVSHQFGSYGPYADNGIYTASTTGWMYLGVQAGTWSGYSNGYYLVDDVSFKQIP